MHAPVPYLLLTLGVYVAGSALQRAARNSPLLNPTLLSIAAIATLLLLLQIDYRTYFAASQPVHVLLGPAVIALAVPLYRQLPLFRQRASQLGLALCIGSSTAITSSIIIAWLFDLPSTTVRSLAAKSATTGVSMGISGQIGGIPPLTAVLTILTGVVGALIGGYILKALRIKDAAARGFSMGLAGHGIATARAFQESETAGTFSGVAMALNAVATTVLAPIIAHFILK